MTDDVLGSARLLLNELRASQAYVRVAAARVLPYRKVLAMEQRASARCAELLAEVGVRHGFEPFDRESIVFTVRHEIVGEGSAPQARQVTASPEPVPRSNEGRPTRPPASAPQTIDDLDDQLTVADGPKKARKTPKSAPRRGGDAPRRAASPGVAAKPGTQPAVASSPPPGLARVKTAAPAAEAPAPRSQQSFVSFDDPAEKRQPDYVSYGDDGSVVEPQALETQGVVPSDPGHDHAADNEATTVKAADAVFGEPAPSADDTQPPANVRESLDPAVGGPDSSKSLFGGGAAARPSATSGLYGGASVPTVRGADASRPRAAAIQLNAGGTGGRMVVEDEDEPIEIGEAEGDYEEDSQEGGGFSVSLRDDEYDEYEEEEEEAAGASPEEPLQAVAEMIVEPTRPTADELSSILSQAHSVASTGNLQGAADLYSDVIDAEPNHAGAHVARGRLYLDLGDYSRAMSDFMVAEELAQEDPEPQVAIGDLYFARKDYRKAIEYFNAALDMSPSHAMAFCRRGISHYYRKNYRDALEDLLRAEDLEPEIPNITTYVSMARKKAARR